jgi:hypothetical protein
MNSECGRQSVSPSNYESHYLVRARDTKAENVNAYRVLVGKPEEKPLGRPE